MHRHLRWVAALMALALIGAACGSSDSDGTSATDASTTEAPAETTAPETDETSAPATEPAEAADPLKIGMILVGPQDDRGWSQAHFEGGQYLQEQLGAELIVIDSVNPADRPDTSVEQVVDDMVAQGAQLIFATSDDMKDGILAGAAAHPDVPMIWSSGDSAWQDGESYADLANLGNIMGKMEFGKMIAGCAAALKSETGSIGYVGPLINDETRRLVNSAYLGANYCWDEYRGAPSELDFEVNWIGFWFAIPGVTLDPTQVTNEFLDGGADVIISGIDTTEGIVRTGQRAEAGETVWAVPYDFEGACDEAPDICLGVPYFNWGPSYLEIAQAVSDGSFESTWQWLEPNWDNITDNTSTAIGFIEGNGLGDAAGDLNAFISGLADGSINLFSGPLNFQDGSVFLGDGEEATEQQIWYTTQLLEGIAGASSSE